MSNPLEGPEEAPKKGVAEAVEAAAGLAGAAAPAPLPSEEALTAAVDALAHPMMAMLADGLLLHANLAARELLAQGAPLELGPDRRVAPRLLVP